MRRFAILFALALATAMPALGWTEPPMLTYKNTVLMEGKSKEEIDERSLDWMSKASIGYSFLDRSVHLQVKDCPNFGASPLLGGTGTFISFDFKVISRNYSYTAIVTNIMVISGYGYLYGENGELIPECYTKKMMKKSPPLLDFLSGYFDNLFKEFEAYMKAE